MRCFLALEIAPATVESLEDLQADLPCGRIVPAENMHLTLAFLDERTLDDLEAVHDAMSGLDLPCFSVEFTGLGLYGGAEPTMLYAAVAKTDALARLHGKIRSLLHGAGLALPRARFDPHVTLARFARAMPDGDAARLARFLGHYSHRYIPPFDATQVTLFRSILGRAAPVYEPLCDYLLTKAAAKDG